MALSSLLYRFESFTQAGGCTRTPSTSCPGRSQRSGYSCAGVRKDWLQGTPGRTPRRYPTAATSANWAPRTLRLQSAWRRPRQNRRRIDPQIVQSPARNALAHQPQATHQSGHLPRCVVFAECPICEQPDRHALSLSGAAMQPAAYPRRAKCSQPHGSSFRRRPTSSSIEIWLPRASLPTCVTRTPATLRGIFTLAGAANSSS